MKDMIEILFFISLTGTILALLLGLRTMFLKQTNHVQLSNRFMRLRVALQGLSIMLFLLLLLMK
ncbi:MAG: HIG1 domain-containing protein [Pseudomonadota bacterium]|jgi:hypothetical protein